MRPRHRRHPSPRRPAISPSDRLARAVGIGAAIVILAGACGDRSSPAAHAEPHTSTTPGIDADAEGRSTTFDAGLTDHMAAAPFDTALSDSAAPDSAAPDSAAPDSAAPESALSDTGPSEVAVSEVAVSEVAPPDSVPPDTAPPDTGAPETATGTGADAATDTPQAATPDAGCVQAKESCDGLDNDCDGLTDEDFFITDPASGQEFHPGDSCDTPWCSKGVMSCVAADKADCTQCGRSPVLEIVLADKGAKKSPLTAKGSFVDVTAKVPIGALTVVKGSPAHVPEGSAAMAIDADGDGDLDLVMVDGYLTVLLLTRLKPWVYAPTVIAETKEPVYVLAATDDDRDGIPEILVGGYELRRLERTAKGGYAWHNDGLSFPGGKAHIQHLGTADLNRDGLLDLVVGTYSCDPAGKAIAAWISRGQGGYEPATKVLGLEIGGSAWALMHTDYDGDGRGDLLVLLESCPPEPGHALLVGRPWSAPFPYGLQPSPPLFTAPGGQQRGSPMGAAVADVNADGVLDYLLAEIELRSFAEKGGKIDPVDQLDSAMLDEISTVLLLSQPGGGRVNAALPAGLVSPLSATGKPMVGWSPVFADLDHDGHLDLLLSHADDTKSWLLQDLGGMRPVAWRNDGTQRFIDVSATWGLPAKHRGRAMIAADLDGDGDLDLVLGGQATGPRILRNDLVHGGASIAVELVGHASNRWGLGARLVLTTDQRVLYAEHSVQAPSQTMATPRTFFALRAGEKPKSLEIDWPSGWVSTVAGPGTGRLTVEEPALFALSSRWSPGGKTPVKVSATRFSVSGQPVAGKPCTLSLAAGAKGTWLAPPVCKGATCTRTWVGNGATGGSDAFVIACDGKAWRVRPRVYY